MTAALMTVRETPTHLEVLTATHNGAEHWEPYATVYAHSRMLELPDGTPFPRGSLAEELQREGWIAPDEDLAAHICDAQAPDLTGRLQHMMNGARCLKRRDHDGPHGRPSLTWDEDL